MIVVLVADLQYWSFGICAIRTEVHSIYFIDAHSLQYREVIDGS